VPASEYNLQGTALRLYTFSTDYAGHGRILYIHANYFKNL
jgi:hypothetical protein